MAERHLFPEFRDELELTRYPFADGASLTADTGQVLDHDTFLDASLYPLGAGSRLHISRIVVTTRDTTIVLSDGARREVASCVFSSLTPGDVLRFSDAQGRPAGILVSETMRLTRFSAWEVGTHLFALGAAEFVASCVIPTPASGVRGIGTAAGEILAGDLWLLGDNGVVVREETGNIRIDIVGDPLFVRRLCEPVDRFDAPNFIRTINHCPPDEFGNFNLTVGDHIHGETIVRIYAANDGLVVEAIGQTRTLRGVARGN